MIQQLRRPLPSLLSYPSCMVLSHVYYRTIGILCKDVLLHACMFIHNKCAKIIFLEIYWEGIDLQTCSKFQSLCLNFFYCPRSLHHFPTYSSWQDVSIRTHDDHRRQGYTPSLRVGYALLMVYLVHGIGSYPRFGLHHKRLGENLRKHQKNVGSLHGNCSR